MSAVFSETDAYEEGMSLTQILNSLKFEFSVIDNKNTIFGLSTQ